MTKIDDLSIFESKIYSLENIVIVNLYEIEIHTKISFKRYKIFYNGYSINSSHLNLIFYEKNSTIQKNTSTILIINSENTNFASREKFLSIKIEWWSNCLNYSL